MWGLVFAGGGGKGAYEVGVWQALDELKITKKITGVSGTSVGALNGAFFAGNTLSSAKSVWSNISQEKILTPCCIEKKLILASGIEESVTESIVTTGVFSQDGLSKIISQNLDFNNVRKFHGNVFAACTEVPDIITSFFMTIYPYVPKFMQWAFIIIAIIGALIKRGTATYFNLTQYDNEYIEKILLASSAIPLVFPNIHINGTAYTDGAISDNIPIKPLYDMGLRKIIVVLLDDDNTPDITDYPDTELVFIIPSENLGNFFNGVLNFSSENARELMKLGYDDALRILSRI